MVWWSQNHEVQRYKTHMEYVLGVQAPLLLMKATSMAVCCGVHSPILCHEGNIRGRMLWVCIHPYSVVKATSVAVYRGCVLTHILLWRQHPWPYIVGVHLDTAQPCHLLKPNWKPSSSHSISILTNISTQFPLQSVYVCVCVCACVCACMLACVGGCVRACL